MIKKSLKTAVALVVACVLTACPGTEPETGLILWHAWGGKELSALKELIAIYRQAHPGADVMALQVPYDKLKDKYLRSAAANGGPDLLIGDADWSGKFAATKPELVLATDEVFSAAELARFRPKTLDSLRLNGKLYAIPESRETVVLYYNKRLLATPPTTVADWFKQAESAGAAGGDGHYGLVFNAAFYYLMGYFFANGGRLFDDAGKVAVHSPGGIAALGMLDRMSRAKGILTSPEYGKGDSLYKEGKAAMILNGPWALADYQEKLGADLGVALLPKLDNGTPAAPWVGVKCMMFNANSDAGHRQQAKDFALFMTSPASQRLLAEKAGHIPAVRDVALDPASPHAIFQAQAEVGTPVSIRSEVSLVWEPMDKAIRQVIQHESDPDKALANAQEVIEAKLEAVRGQQK